MSDYDVAVGTLASLNWNLEQAIEAHLMQDTDDISDDPEIIEAAPTRGIPSSSGPGLFDIECVFSIPKLSSPGILVNGGGGNAATVNAIEKGMCSR